MVFLAIGLLLAVGLRLNPREVPSPLINQLAPDFRLPRLLAQHLELAQVEEDVRRVLPRVLQQDPLAAGKM